MTRIAWLNDGFVEPAGALVSLDDPGFRLGVGLFETMRATDGRVPWLERHLERLARSTAALRLTLPDLERTRAAIVAVAARFPTGHARVRATLTPFPTLLVEGTATTIDPAARVRVVGLRGTWHPGRALAEHKTLSFLDYEDAQRRAHQAGADTALLLDDRGRLGEAARANVFCLVAGELVTAPIQGLLPGVTRTAVMAAMPVREAVLDEDVWRAADGMFLTSAVQHVVPVSAVDGAPLPVDHTALRALREQIGD